MSSKTAIPQTEMPVAAPEMKMPQASKPMASITFTAADQSGTLSFPSLPAVEAKKSDPMATLLRNQMQSFVAKMAADGTLTKAGQEAAMAQVAEMMNTIAIPAQAPRTRTKKVVPAENRCMARVWGGGCGTQCTFSRKPGCGDYCSRCHKKAQECAEPLQFTEQGKHKGLFWGRIDQPKPFMSDGYIVCQWKDDECATQVAAKLAEGVKFHPFSGEAKKKVKGPRKPRAAKKSKAKKPKARRAKNAFFWFLGEKRQEKKAELLAAAAEGEKVGVADVTKALGAVWKTMDEDARAPYVALEKEDKAKAQAELEASLATINEQETVTAAASMPSSSLATIPSGLGNDEVGQILAQGLTNATSSTDTVVESVDDIIAGLDSSNSETLVKSALIPDDSAEMHASEEEEDEEEVEEHTLADGSVYYLGSDGTLYDMETSQIAGTLNSETNTLVPQ